MTYVFNEHGVCVNASIAISVDQKGWPSPVFRVFYACLDGKWGASFDYRNTELGGGSSCLSANNCTHGSPVEAVADLSKSDWCKQAIAEHPKRAEIERQLHQFLTPALTLFG